MEHYIIDGYIYDFSNITFISDTTLSICEDYGIDPCMLGLCTIDIIKGENTHGPGTAASTNHSD